MKMKKIKFKEVIMDSTSPLKSNQDYYFMKNYCRDFSYYEILNMNYAPVLGFGDSTLSEYKNMIVEVPMSFSEKIKSSFYEYRMLFYYFKDLLFKKKKEEITHITPDYSNFNYNDIDFNSLDIEKYDDENNRFEWAIYAKEDIGTYHSGYIIIAKCRDDGEISCYADFDNIYKDICKHFNVM